MKVSGRTWLIVALAGGAALLYFSSRSRAASSDVVPASGNDAQQAQGSGGGAAPAGGGQDDTAALLAALGQQNSDLTAQLLTTAHAFGTASSGDQLGPAPGGNPSNTTTTTDAGPVTTTDAGASLGYVSVPAGTDIGTVDNGGIPYTGYTQQPYAASSTTGDPVLGIVPGVTYKLGRGEPVLDSAFPASYTTPAVAINAVGERNAVNYATKTGQAVAA